MFHHKPIKKFSIDGTLYDEAHASRLKAEYLALLVLQMKASGYVVRADIDPDFTMSYNGSGKGFCFRLSIYGVFLGKRKAQAISSMYGYRPTYERSEMQKKQKRPSSDTA